LVFGTSRRNLPASTTDSYTERDPCSLGASSYTERDPCSLGASSYTERDPCSLGTSSDNDSWSLSGREAGANSDPCANPDTSSYISAYTKPYASGR
jgi:hypothetical protein